MIKKRLLRTGDGTHPYAIEAKEKNLTVADNNNEGEDDLEQISHYWGFGELRNQAGMYECLLNTLLALQVTKK